MKTETWKAVKGYEGKYEVSDRGRVRSANGLIKLYVQKSNGYVRINLWKEGKGHSIYVHRIVADAFIENKPKDCDFEVMHLDGIRTHNNISNLKYGSRACNFAFKVEHGTELFGEKNHKSKLSRKDVEKIKSLYGHGHNTITLGKKFNVTRHQIGNIVNGRSWAWLE